MNACPRVAFFPDTFHEVNGVTLTSRQLDAFARRRELPFLNVHCGPKTELLPGSLELRRSAAAFHLDSNLLCDPLLMRHAGMARRALRDFRPDLIHVTGPGDTGMLGLYLSRKMGIPLVASWHTSLHECAGMRLKRMFSFLSEAPRNRVARAANLQGSANAHIRFWRLATFSKGFPG